MLWRTLALMVVASCLSLWVVWAQSEKRVTIELKDAPIVDAFDQLFRAAGENFILQPGVPKEQRLTMRLVDVPFEKALNFLCDLAGLKWERKENIYIISAKPQPFIFFQQPPFRPSPAPHPPLIGPSPVPKELERFITPLMGWVKQFVLPTITVFMRCPKCGESIQRACPQCKRPIQPHWQFCPFDGTRVAPIPEKCPKCGEPLKGWKIEGEVKILGATLTPVEGDVAIFFTPREEMTLQVLDEQGNLLSERKLAAEQRYSLRLSELLGRKPEVGVPYRFRLLNKEGREVATVSMIVRR